MNNWWITAKVGEEYRLDLLRELSQDRQTRLLTGARRAGVWYPIMAVIAAAMLTTAAVAWRVLN